MYDDAQLRSRGFWQDVAIPEAGRAVSFPGGFALFDGERPGVRRPAPRLGEHNEDVYVGELKLDRRELEALRTAGVV